MKLKLNDQIKVVAGKDKGREGQVSKVLPKANKVIVKGINLYKRHLKKQSDQNPGGIVSVERPLPVANVQLLCPNCHKITRVHYQVAKTHDKIRICAKCDQPVDKK